MISQIMNIVNQVFSACSGWFTEVFAASEMIGIYLAFIVVSLSVRYLFGPMFFSAGSDRVRKKNDNGDD